MSYSRFTLEKINADFGVELKQGYNLFDSVPEAQVRPVIAELLRENYPLAQAIATEKIKSELLVAPMLVEMKRLAEGHVSFFSGVDFNVAPKQGLSGFCDFLISKSPQQFTIEAPVVALVEAKKGELKLGLPQCVAEMIAARIFNERKGHPLQTIYGCVTSGNQWCFLKLVDNTALVDSKEYSIENPHKIMGILLSMVGGA
jgi:hypothetical protein